MPGQFAQCLARIIQEPAGLDFFADGKVVAGLGLQGVRDGRQSHLETLLCLVQRARDGILVRLDEFQVVERPQDQEISRGDPGNQVLLCSHEFGVRLRDHAIRLLQLYKAFALVECLT